MLDRSVRSTNIVDKRLGERVRAARLERGMSQEALADALSITFQQIQKYEKGLNRIAASRLVQIAAVLKVPIKCFFEGLAGTEPADDGARQEHLATANISEHVRLFSQIKSRAVRRKVLDLVRAMADEESQAEISSQPD